MFRPELGVCLDDLRLDVKSAMDRARTLGFQAIDVGATAGALSPGELSQTGRRHVLKHLSDLGLRLSSLRGPTGGPGYSDGAAGERRLDSMRGVLRMAADLGVPVVSTILGVSGAEAKSDVLLDILRVLADDADRCGVAIAIETAGIEAKVLSGLLQRVDCPFVAACCDSGAMLMQGDDPHALGTTLPGRIQLVRARDAVAGTPVARGYEVVQGQGQLDPARFIGALAEAGYGGDIILSRVAGRDAATDLQHARELFEKVLDS
jgi:sugar phosphate isomerase/epimerase